MSEGGLGWQIAVGVDRSPAAAIALQWGLRFGGRVGADVTAVHAFERTFSEASPEVEQQQLEEIARSLPDALAPITAGSGLAVDWVVESGQPESVLPHAAYERDADLVVMGRGGGGRPSPGFLHVGSAVEKLAHSIDLPIAVVPVVPSAGFDHIVVGVDEKLASMAAVRWVAHVAPVLSATVTAVHVESAGFPPRDDHADRDIRWQAQTWADPISRAGVDVEPVALWGRAPSKMLLAEARARAASMLVVGAPAPSNVIGTRAVGVEIEIVHHADDLVVVLVPPQGPGLHELA